MCGIAGYFGPRKLAENVISNTLGLMENRGPNSKKVFRFNFKKKSLYFFHSRLKIIDLSDKANQPFFYKGNILIFNGEIYNYLEIRNRLKKLGYKFKTKSDTEVVLIAYVHFGEKCLEIFEGMWAIAIWDDKRKKLFFSRDRFGEKPLFYHKNSDSFYFGSETKYIQSLSNKTFEPNKNLIKKHITHGYKSIHKSNDTYFKEIYTFKNSNFAYLDYNSHFTFKNYWQPKLKEDNSLSFKDVCKHSEYLLKESIKTKLQSDVPLALSLSGGIDSSIIAGIVKKDFNKDIRCFSLLDKGRYNEEKNINLTKNFLKVKINKVNINYNNFIKNLKLAVNYQNEPIQTINYFAQNFLMREVSNENYRVIMSGTGADEIFTGYYNHFLQFFSTIKKKSLLKKNINDWKKFILPVIRNKDLKNPYRFIKNPNDRKNIYDNYDKTLNLTKFKVSSNFKEEKFTSNLLRNRMHNEIFYETTPVTLRHEDLNCMQYSIENRSPFLDSKLYEFANTIPTKYLIQKGYQKFILRETFKKRMHKNIATDRAKVGFNASFNLFIQNEKKSQLDKFFNEKSIINEFVNMRKISSLINNKKNTADIQKFLFNIMNIKIFLDKFY